MGFFGLDSGVYWIWRRLDAVPLSAVVYADSVFRLFSHLSAEIFSDEMSVRHSICHGVQSDLPVFQRVRRVSAAPFRERCFLFLHGVSDFRLLEIDR